MLHAAVRSRQLSRLFWLATPLFANAGASAAFTTSASANRSAPAAADDSEKLQLPDGRRLTLSRTWLRLNCRCSGCYNEHTQQRIVPPAAALRDSAAPLLGSETTPQGQLVIRWADGHESAFGDQQLAALLPQEPKLARRLWGPGELADAAACRSLATTVEVDEFLRSEDACRRVLSSLWSVGFAEVVGVDPTEAATVKVVERLAPVMKTMLNGILTFSAKGEMQDTAFGRGAIGLHTDTSYYHQCAGLQVFHALSAAPVGGSSGLVDGFLAAETLRRESPEQFCLLSNLPVYHQNLQRKPKSDSQLAYNIRCLERVISVDPENRNEMYQIRYNPYDLASLSGLRPETVRPYVAAYAHLSEILERDDATLWLNLRPGTVLFIDNWRVLHSRTAFEGPRTMTSAYVRRDDWTNKARVMGVTQ